MSPILVRPFREQYEHDRIIRLLQARFRRRFSVGVNSADARAAPVRYGATVMSPDLVLSSPGGVRQVQGVVEVETTESVNYLEAMAQWARFARLRKTFYLYVPAGSADGARRLCEEHRIGVSELWSYHTVGDHVRFTLIQKISPARAPKRRVTARRKRSARATVRKRVSRKPASRAVSPRKKAPARSSRARARTGRAKKRK